MNPIVFFSLRNFGDAVILKYLIDQIFNQDKNLKILIIGKEEFEPIFSEYKFLPVMVPISFSLKSLFNFNNIANLFLSFYKIRRMKAGMAFSVNDDFREHFYLKLIQSSKKFQIKFNNKNPLSRLVKNNYQNCTNINYIYSNSNNYYLTLQEFFSKIFSNLKFKNLNSSFSIKHTIKNIGVFPFASHESRQLPPSVWFSVINHFSKKYKINIYLSNSDLDNFIPSKLFNKNVNFFTLNIKNLIKKVKVNDFGISLDSFGYHLFSSYDIPVFMISGSNDPALFFKGKINRKFLISNGEACKYYSCYNKPKCINTDFKYVCIRDVKSENIIKKIEKIINV